MTSPRQQAANLANAQKSTGPITPEGKSASSQNHRKLGLAAGIFKVLPDECQEDFEEYATNLYLEYHPQTLSEKTLADERPPSACTVRPRSPSSTLRRIQPVCSGKRLFFHFDFIFSVMAAIPLSTKPEEEPH